MKWKWLVITFIVAVVVTNFPLYNKSFLLMFDGEGHFRYANADATFTRAQRLGFKDGFLTDRLANNFIEETQPAIENRQIYRLYRINPLCFWRWYYYIFIARNFEYKSWEEIEPHRVPYDPENRWQDF